MHPHQPHDNSYSNPATGDTGRLPAYLSSDPVAATFNQIFLDTKDRMYQFVRKLTHDESEIKDIVQDCYVSLWQHIHEIDLEQEVLPLLFTYARNRVIDYLRKRTTRQQLLQEWQPADGDESPAEQLLDYKERLQQLQVSINRLPSHRKKIFTMVKQDGFSHKEVAEHLGISTATVKKQIGLSLRFLKEQLPR
ncbi:MAG: RNA polymerase sigma-70 factor [Chitinophaga sp.]|uniref:RNA polymerase sigma-70 factor n=1 Tax=Chitinophaga sp. TaxID=1869181 RepID=UPI001B228FA6|nr:RNA polymerase sigma-70 factor [Chitinophaga sp.]MBO9730724.1 RNA polymerase sigma-70 factor [Chitinophaga sp.]